MAARWVSCRAVDLEWLTPFYTRRQPFAWGAEVAMFALPIDVKGGSEGLESQFPREAPQNEGPLEIPRDCNCIYLRDKGLGQSVTQ